MEIELLPSIAALLIGIIYGLIIGVIPAAGATTGLVALFPLIGLLKAMDPYLGVVFITAVVAASTTGDTFSSVLLGIPGANSSAATMVDGFPLAQQGKAAYALSAAITVSTVNGLIWGSITFLLLPWYYDFIILPPTEGGVGQGELFALCILAFVTVSFVSNKFWIRSAMALALGIFITLIGTDPETAAPRFTFGWDYLIDGVPMIPVIAGLFAMPELIQAFKNQQLAKTQTIDDHSTQIWDGIKISFVEWKLSLRGGVIGAIVGFLPGIGGGMSDWLSYGQAVASNPNEKIPFGEGNIKGVIGPEGSNNAQKASSFIPTVLFGIPGAPFAAVIIGLFSTIGFELTIDSASLLGDGRFFDSLSFGFLTGTLITGIICLYLIKYIAMIAYLPYKYYFPVLIIFIVWATYSAGFSTYGFENIIALVGFTMLGLFMKRWQFSRPAFIIGFMLGDKIEQLFYQTFQLFNIGGIPLIKIQSFFTGAEVGDGNIRIALGEGKDLLTHPVFVAVGLLTIIVIIWGFKNRSNISYS